MQVSLFSTPELWVPNKVEGLITNAYKELNTYSLTTGRISALFLPACEILLELIEKPLTAIESVAKSGMNIFGCCFYAECSVKKALFYAEKAVSSLIQTPLSILPAPVQYVQQVSAAFFDPNKASPINAVPTLQTSSYAKNFFASAQNKLYVEEGAPRFSPLTMSIVSPILSLADVFLDVLAPIASAVEKLARAVMQLAGALFYKSCSIKGAIYLTKEALQEISNAAAALTLSPLKFCYQTCAIIYDPTKAVSIRNLMERSPKIAIDLDLDTLRNLSKQQIENLDLSKLNLNELCTNLDAAPDKEELLTKFLGNISTEELEKIIENLLPHDLLDYVTHSQITKLAPTLCHDKLIKVFSNAGKSLSKNQDQSLFPGLSENQNLRYLLQALSTKQRQSIFNQLPNKMLQFIPAEEIKELDVSSLSIDQLHDLIGRADYLAFERFANISVDQIPHILTKIKADKRYYATFLRFFSAEQLKITELDFSEATTEDIHWIFRAREDKREFQKKRIENIQSPVLQTILSKLPSHVLPFISVEQIKEINVTKLSQEQIYAMFPKDAAGEKVHLNRFDAISNSQLKTLLSSKKVLDNFSHILNSQRKKDH
jgi:hypothetical protein